MTVQVSTDKLVVILPEGLAPVLALNAAALLGMTLGKHLPDAVGPDVVDASGTVHPGISSLPVPVLRATRTQLADLAAKAYVTPGVLVADVSDVAQASPTYPRYVERLGRHRTDELRLTGLALHGPRAAVTSLTGDLPLYR